MDCRLKLASERWAVDRLLKVIKAPHPVPEVCRKAAMILESLVSEPQNRALLLAFENAFAEILFSDGKYSDNFARILYELTSRPNSKGIQLSIKKSGVTDEGEKRTFAIPIQHLLNGVKVVIESNWKTQFPN
ncbi:hypothetical protein IFM89_010635 [Coptis chinensis]|uniref:Uncharacterized protein n=1 Tax=Coptis chinensis TaxID=261450 RepID=A0A835MAP2_9MAGN|nr:hypothetical protein IFM89_010635 [Coptis chinensis]